MSLSPKIVIVGIIVIIVAASVLFLTINNLDKPIPKPLQDPGLLVESEDPKFAQNLVTQAIKKYDTEGKDLSALDNHLDFHDSFQLTANAMALYCGALPTLLKPL